MPPTDPAAPHVPPVISTRWQLARDAAGAAPGMARELGADIAQAMADCVTPDGVRVPFSTWVIEGRTPTT